MGKHWPLKKNNKGASLIAVLVAISVVSIMGIIITQLTVTNIQMKEVERQAKTNFYDAEHIMDELTAGLNVIAADAMKEAYNEMLGQYRTYVTDGTSANQAFSRLYLEKMIAAFKTTDVGSQTVQEKPDASGASLLSRGYYSISKIKGALKKTSVFAGMAYADPAYSDYTADEKDAFVTIHYKDDSNKDSAVNLDGDPGFQADFVKRQFILEGISISAKDAAGNMVTITTDMVFHTPDVNISGSNLVKEFMRYSLIADDKIENSRTSIKVDGNVYAGKNGINARGGSNADFIGKKIVSRGDIISYSNGSITVGNAGELTRTQIWVNNARTERTTSATSPAKMNLYGYMFISDDLEVNGNKDEVKLAGEYYGYNFQENYDAKTISLKDAEFSSAIVINGKKSNIDLTGLKKLMIAGRMFISRNAGATNPQDIAMGESMGVRTDQIAYYVPQNCIDFTSNTINDTLFQNYSGVANVSSYLKATEPFTEFNYRMGGSVEKIYYLNFANEQMANDFYTAYYLVNGSALKYSAENYIEANALKLSGDVVLQLQGDILYRQGDTGNLVEFHSPIDPEKWGYGKLYYKFSMNHALTYKQLQTNLEENPDGLTAANARLAADATGVFDNLIDRAKLSALVNGENKTGDHQFIKEYVDPTGAIPGKKLIAIVEGDYVLNESTNEYTGGIIVATGNVTIKAGTDTQKFSGTIISGGTITFGNSVAEFEADEVVVSQMISDDVKETIPMFATIFKGYGDAAENAMSTNTINKYLTYDNWTKTYEE